MSAAIDRLRAARARPAGYTDARAHVLWTDLAAALSALDAAETEVAQLRREPAAYKRERDAAIARADYWRTQATAAAPCVDAVRTLGTRLIPGGIRARGDAPSQVPA